MILRSRREPSRSPRKKLPFLADNQGFRWEFFGWRRKNCLVPLELGCQPSWPGYGCFPLAARARCGGISRREERVYECSRRYGDVESGSGSRALQPLGAHRIRVGGSSPRLTAVSTGLRPCVLRASRVSSATTPFSSRSIATRDTSTVVRTSRPSCAVDLIDQEAPIFFERGVSRVDSRTLHRGSATCSP